MKGEKEAYLVEIIWQLISSTKGTRFISAKK